MRVRDVRRPHRAAVACLLAFSVGAAAGCSAGRAASERPSLSRPSTGPGGTAVRVLQVNLCNSGRAACYAGGRAVGRAVALVHQHRPDMLSLNEVCRDDVRVLEQALSAAFPAAEVAVAFAAAKDRPSRAPVRCQNGQEFGDAVIVVVSSAAAGLRRHSGVYPMQDLDDPEERVWVCIDVATRFSACTTHTASTSTAVALDQCRYLLTSVVPSITRGDGDDPVVLGADLNLAARGSPSPQSCLPSGYQRVDDGVVQDVVVSPGAGVRSHVVVDMQGTTDHPALLVDVVLPRP
jgi:hypothetical protein